MSIVSLTPKPTVADEMRASASALLREILDAVEKGEISDVIIIAKQIDGDWRHLANATLGVREQIGALELMKLERAMQHLNDGWDK